MKMQILFTKYSISIFKAKSRTFKLTLCKMLHKLAYSLLKVACKKLFLPRKDLPYYEEYFDTARQITEAPRDRRQIMKFTLLYGNFLYCIVLDLLLFFFQQFSSCNAAIFEMLVRVIIFQQQTAVALPLMIFIAGYFSYILYLTVPAKFLSMFEQIILGRVKSRRMNPTFSHVTSSYGTQSVDEYLQLLARRIINFFQVFIVLICNELDFNKSVLTNYVYFLLQILASYKCF